ALISPQVASAPQTAIGVLASQKLRERVSTKLDLRRRWEVSSYRAVKRLSDVVTPAVDKNGLLVISADDRDPRLAADIVGAYIQTLRLLAKELSLNLSTRNREFLESRLKDSRAR